MPSNPTITGITEFPNGMTVRELKKVIEFWPEVNQYTGEECEVWIETGRNLGSQVRKVWPLNERENDGLISADIILTANREE